MKLKPAPLSKADDPAPFTKAEAAAVKAVYHGAASEHQQKLAMEWVIKAASALPSQSYRADSHATAFIEGRRFVGIQITAILELNLATLKDD